MKIIFYLVAMFSFLLSATGQKLHFESKAPIRDDTLKVSEQKLGDLTLLVMLKATDIKKPLFIQIFTEDHAAAKKGDDYSVNFVDTLNATLNETNSFTTSFNITILSNPFEEAPEHFKIYCGYKDKKGKSIVSTLMVEISKPGNDIETRESLITESKAIIAPTKRQVVYNNGITCDEGKFFELTLIALENENKIEEMEITLSARDKEDKKDTFMLAGNKTHFGNKVNTLAKELAGNNCNDTTFRNSLDTAYNIAINKIKEIEKKAVDKKEEARLNKLKDSIITIVKNAIDEVAGENEDAAIVELKKSSLTLYKDKGHCKCGAQTQDGAKLKSEGNELLKIDSVVFKVFNNTIHQLDIVGTIMDEKVQTISNHNFGIPLRSFIDKANQTISYNINGNTFYICYCELFLIRPSKDGAINYTIKDGDYAVYPSNATESPTKVPIAQKRLLDFFSVSAFFDFLSVDANSPNRALFTEAYFRFNINTNSNRHTTWFKQLYSTVNFAANLSGKDNANMPSVYEKIFNVDSVVTDYRYYVNHFDLYRFAFFQARPMLNIGTFDSKRRNMIVELNSGFHILGSSANIINPKAGNDSMKVRNVFSWSPSFETRFRVTPKSNFGFDFHFSYLPGFKPLAADFNVLTGKESLEYLYTQPNREAINTNMIIGEMNFFFNPKKNKSTTDRGGVYFRMNLAKPINYGVGHFMFFAGYSSDIKTFMR